MRTEEVIRERLAHFENVAFKKYGTKSLTEIPEEGLRNAIYELMWVLDLLG